MTEIDSTLFEAVRKLAAEQGREGSEVLEDAVSYYRLFFGDLSGREAVPEERRVQPASGSWSWLARVASTTKRRGRSRREWCAVPGTKRPRETRSYPHPRRKRCEPGSESLARTAACPPRWWEPRRRPRAAPSSSSTRWWWSAASRDDATAPIPWFCAPSPPGRPLSRRVEAVASK